MMKLIWAGVKMIIVLVVLYVFSVYHLPTIYFLIPLWYLWLYFVIPNRNRRLVATLGLCLTVLGYWGGTSADHYFMVKGERSHSSEQGSFWGGMHALDEKISTVLTLIGIMLLTYADYLGMPKREPTPAIANEVKPEQDHVWPPAPRRLH